MLNYQRVAGWKNDGNTWKKKQHKPDVFPFLWEKHTHKHKPKMETMGVSHKWMLWVFSPILGNPHCSSVIISVLLSAVV